MTFFPLKTLTALVVLAPLGMLSIHGASASGYVASPAARAQLCKTGDNIDCGNFAKFRSEIIKSATTASGFPTAKGIASGGIELYQPLNTEGSVRWSKTKIAQGPLDISWQITSPAHFSNWRYYITQPNWQQTLDAEQQLTAASFEATPFCDIKDDVTQLQQGLIAHHCQLPERSGYQLIYAVADLGTRADAQSESIYNLIDVQIEQVGAESTAVNKGRWTKEIATIDRLVIDTPVEINAGDVVRARFFGEQIGEMPEIEVRITVLPGEETSWSYAMANAINEQHPDIRAGVRQANGEVSPEEQKVNSIFVGQESNLYHAEITVN